MRMTVHSSSGIAPPCGWSLGTAKEERPPAETYSVHAANEAAISEGREGQSATLDS